MELWVWVEVFTPCQVKVVRHKEFFEPPTCRSTVEHANHQTTILVRLGQPYNLPDDSDDYVFMSASVKESSGADPGGAKGALAPPPPQKTPSQIWISVAK